jgi:ATP-dependent helicase HepA
MALDIKIGDLVNSKSFNGVGKVTSISNEKTSIGICFFESPLSPESRTIEVSPTELIRHVLFEEAIVYCRDQDTELWRRARYGGQRPDDMHLLIFRGTETAVLPIAEIYVLNLASGSQFRPADFLAMRANDAMYYASFRERFIKAYIAQRASCKSIASIPSSSVELEPHQIAVVRRVLQDPIPKYLLADEVGLGKTIEAGLIIREHLLEKKRDANVVVAVPKTLLDQWRQELKIRFHLGELFDIDNDDPELPLKIYAHDDLNEAIKVHGDPTLFVIDEAHQISQYAWSIEANKRNLFKQYSSACQASESVLLLSGTPLNGNEKNFLAMLHCLNHEAYSISEDGIRRFMEKVEEREQLGGLYSALTINNQNIAIEGILDQLALLFPDDIALIEHLNSVRPFVDFLARETGQDRDFAIRDLRKYIGDNYRLHQRMLRNRRENSGLAVLFPGLAGLIINKWQIDPYSVTVDELIEDYRNLALDNPNDFQGMSSDIYLKWIDDFLISPLCVSKRALHLLNAFNGSLQSVENEILRQLVEVSDREQIEKDDALITALSEWLRAHPDGKAVIFCGDQSVSLHVYEVLEVGLTRTRIEHYTNEHRPEFCQQGSDVRVFVCDYRGEDGLNLHGGRRLAVHYALTRSCSRIEQRLGRLNRYSANLKAVRPVESLIIIPDRDGLVNRWMSI